MEDILSLIDWQIGVELKAAQFYEQGLLFFMEQPKIIHIMNDLIRDERYHARLLEELKDNLAGKECPELPFYFDEEMRQMLESPLLRARESLANGQMTVPRMMAAIYSLESAEVNRLMLFFIQRLGDSEAAVQKMSLEIQGHLERIEKLFCLVPEGARFLDSLRGLSPQRCKHILILEESEVLTRFLEILLGKQSEIETVKDTQTALDRLGRKHYDLIISDLDLNQLNPREFFLKACSLFPQLEKHFLFYTGCEKPEILSFLNARRLPYLKKNSQMSHFRRVVEEMIHVPQEH